MYKLYWAADTGALAPHIVLEEIGADYERCVIDTDKNEEIAEDYLAINPRGQIPALQLDDGTIMTETAAILLQLAESHPEAGLLPAVGSRERAILYRWLFYAASNLYEGYLRFYYSDRYTIEASQSGLVQAAAAEYLEMSWSLLEDALGDGPYFLGDRFSILDAYLLTLSNWHEDREALFAKNPKLKRLCESVRARPAVSGIWPLHFA